MSAKIVTMHDKDKWDVDGTVYHCPTPEHAMQSIDRLEDQIRTLKAIRSAQVEGAHYYAQVIEEADLYCRAIYGCSLEEYRDNLASGDSSGVIKIATYIVDRNGGA